MDLIIPRKLRKWCFLVDLRHVSIATFFQLIEVILNRDRAYLIGLELQISINREDSSETLIAPFSIVLFFSSQAPIFYN